LNGYDFSKLASGSESEGYGLHTYSQIENGNWTIALNDARYIYMTFSKSGASKARFSTSDEFIFIPRDDFKWLADQWRGKSADIGCYDTYCYYDTAECGDISTVVGPIKLQFDSDDYFSVEPHQFMYNGT
jgi:hypothetical protein